jgi:ABC-type multidrug transport system fused ATPase/permease subunit
MIQPLFAKILIDKVFIAHISHLLLPLLFTMILLLIVSFFIRAGNNYIYTVYSAKLLFKMREDLFQHLQRIPLKFYAKQKIGDIYSRIGTDMADVQGAVTETIPHFLFNALTCVITAAILLWLDWRMALMSYCFLPLSLYVIKRIRPKLVDLSRQVAETNADVSHFLFESLSGAALVRAYGAERIECRKLEEKQSHMLRFLLRYQLLGVISSAVPTVFIILNTLVVFGYGGSLVLGGSLSIGSLVGFSIYQGRVLTPLQGMMDGFMALQKSKVALARIREILDIEPEANDDGRIIPISNSLKGDIVFKDVTFSYDESEPLFNGISFHIHPNQTTALIGPSGAGKTTICHLVMRLFDPDSGMITVDGIDLKEYDRSWLRKRFALVSQDIFLFHTSISENIRYANPHSDKGRIVEAAEAACIHEFIESLPHGYDTVVGDRGVRLSGGQKQRISIARAILSQPAVLLLDEATAFLDISAEERLKDALRSLTMNRTILLVSHRTSTVQDADRIIVLHGNGDGRGIAFEGSGADYYGAASFSNGE